MRVMGDLAGMDYDPRQFSESKLLVDSHTYLGLEQEIENCSISARKNMESKFWHEHSEGSLRNSGIEFVTGIIANSGRFLPIRGKNIETALFDLQKWFDKNPNLSFSKRTSFHVHVDVRYLPLEEFIQYIIQNIIFEPLLFKVFSNEYRECENYTFPHYKNMHTQDLFKKLFYEWSTVKTRQDFSKITRKIFQQFPKYSSINLRSFLEWGTIEYRLHPGTKVIEDLFTYINCLLLIKESAKNLKLSSLSEDFREISANGTDNYLSKIFKHLKPVFDIPNSHEYLLQGIRTAQNIVFPYFEDFQEEKILAETIRYFDL